MQQTIRKSGIVLLAFLFAALMAFAALPVHALNFDQTLTIQGVEAGNTVTGYQIVKDDGSGNWVVANSNISIKNPEDPTAAEINKLAGQVKDLGLTTVNFTQQTNGDYTATAPAAGSYLVLVTNGPNANYVYSPMLVSADYDGANGTETLDKTTADAKKTQPGVEKVITKKNGEDPANNKGVTLAPGNTVDFKITPTIPNYGTEYTNATYTVADTLTNMTLSGDITVTGPTGPTGPTEGTDYTVTKTDKTFTVTFTKDFLTNGNAKNVTITYAATLDTTAFNSNFADNPNDVTVTYSNTSDNTKTVEKHTHQYTFDIDGHIDGKTSEQTKDIVKVGVDQKGNTITTTSYGELATNTNPLKDAVFTLSKDGKVIKTVATDDNGLMNFSGLDAGDYILKEKQAPAGYKLDATTEVPVKIEATLNEDGTLASYKITINGKNTNTYTATYDGGVKTVAAANANADNKTSLFNNAKSNGLPATGGAGIFFYLIAGGALVALAVVLYTKNRKNQA